jgi:hypothetical protein
MKHDHLSLSLQCIDRWSSCIYISIASRLGMGPAILYSTYLCIDSVGSKVMHRLSRKYGNLINSKVIAQLPRAT